MSTEKDGLFQEESRSFSFAHLSDLHATPVRMRQISAMLNKRGLAWTKWRLKRKNQYRPEVLTALLADLQTHALDHVVITGDLTNFGLEEEFVAATSWLQRIGDRQHVSLVPGNHDVYVPDSAAALWNHWAEYLRSDAGQDNPVLSSPRTREDTGERNQKGMFLQSECFPTLRIRGPIAFVGVSSAQPTDLLSATGTVGTRQLERLETLLQSLATAPLCRVVLIHHPPTEEGLAIRRRLTDAAALRDVLKRVGAELVLHGHTHKTAYTSVPGPDGPILVIGVRSATAVSHRPERQAQYHLYRVERPDPNQAEYHFRLTMIAYEYEAAGGCFRQIGEWVL